MTVKAPITETLASALLMLTPWKKDRILVDPFCGSAAIFRKIKDRVIAKTVLAFFLVSNAALHGGTDRLSSAIAEKPFAL